MNYFDKKIKDQAKVYWESDRMLDAGKLVFKNVKSEDRSAWAGSILSFVNERNCSASEPINELVRIAKNPSEWKYAHKAFSRIREELLGLEEAHRSAAQEFDYAVLFLAENIAKVIYNGTSPSDPFDEDSGWWIASGA